MTDRELMQQALDALELVTDLTNHDDEVYAAIEALRARLAQPNEPDWSAAGFGKPSKRVWQGLTDEEIKNHWLIAMQSVEGTVLPIPEFARAIEAKLKEKNT